MAKVQEALRSVRKATPRELFEQFDRYVIGQERAKRVMALAAYNHLKRIDQLVLKGEASIRKSNVLLIGPTGVGKTHLARVAARTLDVPFVTVDCTEFTEAGYYGKDVEVMVAELLYACNLDVSACERGIIFVDEIDKIARRSGGMRTGTSRDIGGEGVQQALLKLLEGRRIHVPYNLTQHWNKHDFVEVDTTNILFICAGTFTDVRNTTSGGEVGFSGQPKRRAENRSRIRQKDLIEYGMLTELLGRIPVITQLDSLSTPELERILTEPPDSLVNEYRQVFEMDNVQLQLTKGAISEIAAYAAKRRLGARGLRAIMEEILHDMMFEAPERAGSTVKVTPKFVRDCLKNFDSGMVED